jgi:hypothetical protein
MIDKHDANGRLTPVHKPVGYAAADDLARLELGYSCIDLFGEVVPHRSDMVPLYEHPAPTMASDVEEEQRAFERWAEARSYDMRQHPLHYLFLSAKTDAARQGWKAGRNYARRSRPSVTDEMVEAGLQHYSEGGCSGLADYERREVVRAVLEAALAAEERE